MKSSAKHGSNCTKTIVVAMDLASEGGIMSFTNRWQILVVNGSKSAAAWVMMVCILLGTAEPT